MASLKYLQSIRDQRGVVRTYFRRGRFRQRLPGDATSPEFFAEYAKCLAVDTAVPAPPRRQARQRPAAGTMSALIAFYVASDDFRGLSPITRHERFRVLEAFEAQFGPLQVAGFTRKIAMRLRQQGQARPAATNGLLKVLAQVFRVALDHELVENNPLVGIKKLRERGAGAKTWTTTDMKQFAKRWPSGSTPHLAMTLLFYTAQRRSDVVKLGPGNVVAQGRALRLVQTKNRLRRPVTVQIPIAPQLKAALRAARRQDNVGVDTFLVTQAGRPFTTYGFAVAWRRWAAAAGVNCSPHGARRAMSALLAESGASPSEIGAVTGHSTLREVARYSSDASRQAMARAAFARITKL